MGRGALLAANLPQLQNLIKRDPAGYRDEFVQQYNHYDSIRQLFAISPDDNAAHFRELVAFIAQLAVCYPAETAAFPSHLSTLLLEHYGVLSPDTRKTLLHSLVILRNKNVLTSIECAPRLFFLPPLTIFPVSSGPSSPCSPAPPPRPSGRSSARPSSPTSALPTSAPRTTS